MKGFDDAAPFLHQDQSFGNDVIGPEDGFALRVFDGRGQRDEHVLAASVGPDSRHPFRRSVAVHVERDFHRACRPRQRCRRHALLFW